MINTDDFSTVSLDQLIQANNWQDKYRLITAWGALILVKPSLRKDQYLVKGCEAAAWLKHELNGDRHYFFFDSESRVINGLAAILLSQVNHKTTEELLQIDGAAILKTTGLEKHLTPSRNNGFKKILERINVFVKG